MPEGADGYKINFKALGYEHFMKCFKPAWDMAFTKNPNMGGWRVEGMIPFTHQALWKKVEECREAVEADHVPARVAWANNASRVARQSGEIEHQLDIGHRVFRLDFGAHYSGFLIC